MLHALGSRRRRQLLVDLMEENSRTVTKRVDEIDGDGESERSRILLHHVDLPKLDESEFIAWDRETGRITRGLRFEGIRPLLELLVRHEDELPDDLL